MAKANLPVNFKDDILKENMNGKRRFKMIQNSDGTVSFEDVTDYTQVGSTFGAAQINATNTAVNNAADASKIIDSLDTIKANTKSGYIAGALAVKELSSNLGNEKAGVFTSSLNTEIEINLGFQPTEVIVFPSDKTTSDNAYFRVSYKSQSDDYYLRYRNKIEPSEITAFTNSGFKFKPTGDYTTGNYRYIAIKNK